jgi:hypothetical protein
MMNDEFKEAGLVIFIIHRPAPLILFLGDTG